MSRKISVHDAQRRQEALCRAFGELDALVRSAPLLIAMTPGNQYETFANNLVRRDTTVGRLLASTPSFGKDLITPARTRSVDAWLAECPQRRLSITSTNDGYRAALKQGPEIISETYKPAMKDLMYALENVKL